MKDAEYEKLVEEPDSAPSSLYDEEEKQSSSVCIFNFINSSVGSSVLAAAYIFSLSGYLLGPVVNLFFCFSAMISYFMLSRVADYTNSFQYTDVCSTLYQGVLAKIMGFLSMLAQIVSSGGALISYTVVLRDNLWFFDMKTEKLYADIVVAAIVLCCVMPLTYLRNLEKLRFNSFLVIAVCSYILLCVVGYFIDGEVHHTNQPVRPANWKPTLLNAFSLTIAGYCSHYNFLNLYCELRDRRQNAKRVIWGTSGALVAIYLLFGYFGYLTFGDDTQPDILTNLTALDSVYARIANVAMIIYMVCHYPLCCYAIRRGFENFIYGETEVPKTSVRVLISTCIVIVSLIIGVFMESIDNILDFTSSLAGGSLAFIFPPLFYSQVQKKQGKNRTWTFVYLAFGVCLTGISFASACWKWF